MLQTRKTYMIFCEMSQLKSLITRIPNSDTNILQNIFCVPQMKESQVWNDTKMSKWCQNFYCWMTDYVLLNLKDSVFRFCWWFLINALQTRIMYYLFMFSINKLLLILLCFLSQKQEELLTWKISLKHLIVSLNILCNISAYMQCHLLHKSVYCRKTSGINPYPVL